VVTISTVTTTVCMVATTITAVALTSEISHPDHSGLLKLYSKIRFLEATVILSVHPKLVGTPKNRYFVIFCSDNRRK